MTMGYIRSSARLCHSRTSSSTASVTRLIHCPAGYCAAMPEREVGRDLQAIDIFKVGADVTDSETGGVEPPSRQICLANRLPGNG